MSERLLIYGIYDFRSVDEDIYRAYGRLNKATEDAGFWGLKVDWLLSDNHRIEYTGFSDERTAHQTSFRWDDETGEVGEQYRTTEFSRGGINHILAYRGYFGPHIAASALWGTGEYDLTNTSPEDASCPVALDNRQRFRRVLGCWTNFTTSGGKDERQVGRLDFEWAVGERHLLSFGTDREVKTSFDFLGYSGGSYYRYFRVAPGLVLDNGAVVPERVTEVTRYRQFERRGDFDVIASSFYVEDEWLIAPGATLRLGLRNERYDNRNSVGASFVEMTDQFAPRVGLAWDPNGDGTSRLFANHGRYHLPVASIVNIRMASATLFTEDWYVLDGAIAEDGTTPLETRLGPQTVYANGRPRDVRTIADQDLRPMVQDEYIVGYEWELMEDFVASATFTYRNLAEGIEDVTTDEALGRFADFNYVLANPGRNIRTFVDLEGNGALEEVTLAAEDLGYPPAKRRYQALTFDVKRRWDGVFTLRGAYTVSRSHGNYEGTVRSDTGEDIAGYTTQFDFAGMLDGADGDLPNDRRHMVRAWGAWAFADNWLLSGAFELSSGRPINAFGYHPTDPYASLYGAASFYRQGTPAPRGSGGSTPFVYRLDLGLKHTRDAFGDGKLTVRMDIFNVFDFDDEIEVDEYADTWGRRESSTFGFPIRFQQPRSVRLGLQYSF